MTVYAVHEALCNNGNSERPHCFSLSVYARWKPLEIPSRTRSVSAFHPGRASVGSCPFGNIGGQHLGRWLTVKNGYTAGLSLNRVEGSQFIPEAGTGQSGG